jgi:hypothetical protein
MLRSKGHLSRGLVILVWFAGGCASVDAEPTPAPTPTIEPMVSVVSAGDTATIEAIDEDGAWGTIAIRRGGDTGGYPTNAVDPEHFVVEIWVEYELIRSTQATFGAEDWALATAVDRLPIGRSFIPDPPPPPFADWDLDPLLRGFSGEAFTTDPPVIGGWLYFEVPRDAQDAALALIYRPSGFSEALSALFVREPADAPAPVPTATPDPTPAPLVYEPRTGLPISIIVDPDADELFVEADTCTNSVAGYTISYPDSWFTNTAVGGVPECSWFSPVFYEVDGAALPSEIAIVIHSFQGAYGFVHAPDYTITDDVTIDGWDGGRYEELGGFGPDGPLPRSQFTYEYRLSDGGAEFGSNVFGTTSTAMNGPYELNKAVLDRIMASMRLDH